MKEESLPISFGGSQSLFRRPLRPFRGGIVSPAWVSLGKRFRVGRGTGPPPPPTPGQGLWAVSVGAPCVTGSLTWSPARMNKPWREWWGGGMLLLSPLLRADEGAWPLRHPRPE